MASYYPQGGGAAEGELGEQQGPNSFWASGQGSSWGEEGNWHVGNAESNSAHEQQDRNYDHRAEWQESRHGWGNWNGRRASDDSTWVTWSWYGSWNTPSSVNSLTSEDGSWFETPQCWVWGRDLNSAIEQAVKSGWVQPDRAFCAWWLEQGSETVSDRKSEHGSSHKTEGRECSDVRSVKSDGNFDERSENEKEDSEDRRGKRGYSGKEHVPEHDGVITMREYERRVKIFQSTSSIAEEFQAGRLLERLHGEAWRAAETLEVSQLKCKNGVRILLQHLWDELEPLEYLRVFNTLSYFYDNFHRVRGQEMTQYDTAFRTQCQRLSEAQSPLEGRAKAFWFLRKAGISDELRRQVVSSAGGVYDYHKLRSALVAIVPQVRRQENDQQQDERKQHAGYTRGRGNGTPRAHKVHAVLEDQAEDHLGSEHGDEDRFEDLSDADGLELEAEVLLTAAARKRAEHSKNRGFDRSESPQARERRITDMKKRMPCAACRANGKLVYGHWHSDVACPYYKPKGGETAAASKSVFVVTQPGEDDGQSSDESDAAFIVQMIMMASSERLRKASRSLALTDTCCARTVAGEIWAKQTLDMMHEKGYPYYIIDDYQPFRFGDGPKVWARYAMVLPIAVEGAKKSFLLRVSVVKEDVPLLLSAKVLQSLGTVIDMGGKIYDFRELETKVMMETTDTGHIGFRIFDSMPAAADLLTTDWEQFLETGEEVVFVQCSQDRVGQRASHFPGPDKISSEKNVRFCDVPEIHEYCNNERGSDVMMAESCDSLDVHAQSEHSPVPSSLPFGEQVQSEDHGIIYPSFEDEESRFCEGLEGSHIPRAECLGGDDRGKAEVDSPQYSTPEGSSLAPELEEICEGGVAGTVPPESHSVQRSRGIRSWLSLLVKGPSHPRADELRAGGEGEWHGDGGIRRESQGQVSNLPGLQSSNGRESQQSNTRKVFRLLGFPGLPSDHGNDIPRSTCSSGAGEEQSQGSAQWIFEQEGSAGGRQRGDGRGPVQEGLSREVWSSRGIREQLGRLDGFFRSSKSSSSCEAPNCGIDSGRGEVAQGAEGLGEEEVRCEGLKDSPAVIRAKIRAGNEKRRHAKLGTCRRLLANCRTLAVFACMLASSQVASGVGKVFESVYGCDRPDVVEIFGGSAEVSLQFARRGWNVMQPVDVLYGVDLRDPQAREDVLKQLRKERPRLAIVEYPCRFWTKLTDTNFRTSQQKRRLAKLRKAEEPFLELCEDIFNEQMQRGDDALAENPLCSKSFNVPAMRRVLNHPNVYAGVGHGCRFGVRNCSNNKLVKKPTMWISSSPEICNALSLRCPNRAGHVCHIHGECQGGQVAKEAGKYTPQIAKAIHKGFVETIKRKEPSRLVNLLRAVKKRLGKRETDHEQLKWSHDSVRKILEDNHVFAADDADRVIADPEEDEAMEQYEPADIPPEGITFDIPKGRKLESTTKSLLRKLHCNLGHPSKVDLQRFMRNAGAKQELVEAAGWIECSACAKTQRPRLHRTTRIPPSDLQFNDEVLVDCFHLKDAKKKGYWFFSILDRATMYHQACVIEDHSPKTFVSHFFEKWIRWAGNPGEITIDMERGFGSQEFANAMGEAGIHVFSIAGQAHWQHGKIERHGAILKDMMSKTIIQAEVTGKRRLDWLCVEVSMAKNSLIREHGFSPSQLVFGRDPRCYGELVENGEPCSLHLSVGDRNSQIAQRMKYRHVARQEFIKCQSNEMMNRTARNRTRSWKEPSIGDRCFFYREVRKKGISGKFPCWQGPALVVGIQGQSNFWVVFGGRCFLVAQEHMREATGEEALYGRPEVQEALALFKDSTIAKEGVPYVDLTENKNIEEGDVDMPVEEGIDSDEEMIPDAGYPPVPSVGRFVDPPVELSGIASQQGWHVDHEGNPVHVGHRVYSYKTPMPQADGNQFPIRTTWANSNSRWMLLENSIDWTRLDDAHEVFPHGPIPVVVTVFGRKTRKQICEDSVPVCIKRQRIQKEDHDVFLTLSKRKAQKAMDKEIPFRKIRSDQLEDFMKAEEKEWQSWLDYDAVEVIDVETSDQIKREKPSRIIKSRYVYRDKNAGLVNEDGSKRELKAKARLCVQGQHCPDCASGEVKVDAPTVQHSSLMLFLHLVVSKGWIDWWRNGDISSAFLQGAESKGEPLYMYPPERGLPGISSEQILRLKRPVYGRPDAPRAWYEQLAGFITGEMGFQKSILDPALFVHRRKDGVADGLIVLHVDDLMVATDGNETVENSVRLLCERFPFGEWGLVEKQPGGITYCGKEIIVETCDGERNINLRQRGFVEGRLESVPISKDRKNQPSSKATPEEVSDFRSVLGALQWLSTQSRPDISFMVNQLQKRVNMLEVKDLEVANQIVRIVKKHEVSLTFRNLGEDVAIVSYHDAGLYNSLGVEIEEDDNDLVQSFQEKRLLYSQKGNIVGIVRRSDLERTSEVPMNVLQWKTRTNRRIVESSFAAETHAAHMGYGNGHYLRVLYLEIMCGSNAIQQDEGADWFNQMPLVMATDCKSVFDCISREGQSIGDRSNAINVAVLRQLASTDKHPSGQKARMLWVPTRHQLADPMTKAGKSSVMQNALASGTAVYHGVSAKSLRDSKENRVSVNFG